MKTSSPLIPALLILLASCCSQGEALRCWVCSSLDGGHCSDPFNASSLSRTAECSSVPHSRNPNTFPTNSYQPTVKPVCKKVKQLEHGALMIVRSCGFETYPGEACGAEDDRRISPRHHRDDVTWCQACREDGCNSATSTFSLLAAMLASAGALLLAYFA